MSAYNDGNYLTEKGRALIAKLMASETEIKFTRATVGSGSVPVGSSPKEMEALAEHRVDGVLSEISVNNPGEVQIVFQVFSRDVQVGFLASEAAIWAEDPDEGEILYTYVVMDNNPEFIRASSDPVQKFAEFTCINIVGSVEADLTVINPDAIATRRMVDALQTEVDTLSAIVRSSILGARKDIVIPSTGWQTGAEEAPEYAYYIDIEIEGVHSRLTPMVTVNAEDMEKAYNICLNSVAKTGDGFVRLYANEIPNEEINASVMLLMPAADGGDVPGGGGGGGEYVLPTATASRLGGVKIGDGVAVENDGTISIDGETVLSDDEIIATDEDTEDVIKEVFGE